MKGLKGKEYLKEYGKLTEDIFDNFIDEEYRRALSISKIPAEMVRRYHQTARLGKRLRGALVCLGYQLAGKEIDQKILKTSLFVEVFHAGILMHDDIMDQADMRRGVKSIHRQFEDIGKELGINSDAHLYGQSMAINTGDFAFYLSMLPLLHSDFPDENKLQALQIYTDYTIRLVYGQILDITNVSIKSTNEEDILKILKYKTAEYTSVMPILVGMALGGLHDKKITEAIIKFGLEFGWAFQIQDDVLGMYGDDEDTGKPSLNDLREGKNTLLQLHLSEHGSISDKKYQKDLLGNEKATLDDLHMMRKILKESGSLDFVLKKGWEHVENGRRLIPKITKNKKIAEILDSLITYMMERTR